MTNFLLIFFFFILLMSAVSLEDSEVNRLAHIIRFKYINIYKFLGEFDSRLAAAFIHKNTDALQARFPSNQEAVSKRSQKIMFKFYFPEEKMTHLEKELNEKTKLYKIKEMMPKMLEFASAKFFKIKEGGIKDGLTWDDEAEKTLMSEALNAFLTFSFFKELKAEFANTSASDSKAPLLWANPNQWQSLSKKNQLKIELGNLEAKTLEEIGKTKDHTTINSFFKSESLLNGIRKEVLLLDSENMFSRPKAMGEQKPVRNDKVITLSLSTLNKHQFPLIYQSIGLLYSIPFELNQRLKWFLQVSETVQITCFPENGFHSPHFESGFGPNDSGTCLSVLVSLGESSTEISIVEKQEEKVILLPGQAWIGKSRKVGFGLKVDKAGYLIRYWVKGPDDKNKLF